MQKGVSCKGWQSEFLFNKNAICTRFWAICSKMKCNMPLNAMRFGAKRKAKCR